MRQQAIHEAELQATLDHLKERFSSMGMGWLYGADCIGDSIQSGDTLLRRF
jgi:hypothetical protein